MHVLPGDVDDGERDDHAVELPTRRARVGDPEGAVDLPERDVARDVEVLARERRDRRGRALDVHVVDDVAAEAHHDRGADDRTAVRDAPHPDDVEAVRGEAPMHRELDPGGERELGREAAHEGPRAELRGGAGARDGEAPSGAHAPRIVGAEGGARCGDARERAPGDRVGRAELCGHGGCDEQDGGEEAAAEAYFFQGSPLPCSSA